MLNKENKLLMTRWLTIILLFLATSASAIRDKRCEYAYHFNHGKVFLEADGGGKYALREFRKAKRAVNTEEIRHYIKTAKIAAKIWKQRS